MNSGSGVTRRPLVDGSGNVGSDNNNETGELGSRSLSAGGRFSPRGASAAVSRDTSSSSVSVNERSLAGISRLGASRTGFRRVGGGMIRSEQRTPSSLVMPPSGSVGDLGAPNGSSTPILGRRDFFDFGNNAEGQVDRSSEGEGVSGDSSYNYSYNNDSGYSSGRITNTRLGDFSSEDLEILNEEGDFSAEDLEILDAMKMYETASKVKPRSMDDDAVSELGYDDVSVSAEEYLEDLSPEDLEVLDAMQMYDAAAGGDGSVNEASGMGIDSFDRYSKPLLSSGERRVLGRAMFSSYDDYKNNN